MLVYQHVREYAICDRVEYSCKDGRDLLRDRTHADICVSIGSVDVLVALSDTELRQLEPVVDGFRAGVVVAFAGRALGAFDDPYFVGVREDEETIVYRKGVHGMFGNTARFVGNDLVTRDTSVR